MNVLHTDLANLERMKHALEQLTKSYNALVAKLQQSLDKQEEGPTDVA